MSLWDNVKKFAAPYSDDDYDDYDEDEEYADDDYEEEEAKPARRSAPARRTRPAAPAEEEPEEDELLPEGPGAGSQQAQANAAPPSMVDGNGFMNIPEGAGDEGIPFL